jgi:hypothetical protein
MQDMERHSCSRKEPEGEIESRCRSRRSRVLSPSSDNVPEPGFTMKCTSQISRVNDGALLYVTQRSILFSPAPHPPVQLNRPSSSSSLSSSYVTQFQTSALTD